LKPREIKPITSPQAANSKGATLRAPPVSESFDQLAFD